MNVPIFLAHDPDMRARYYGERALAGLRALGPVVLNPTDRALTPAELIAAAENARIIVADRMTVGPAEVFAALPDLAAFVRVAVDIRNIDVPAASAAGVLVTQASPGFAAAVAELGLGLMISLARRIPEAVADYRAGREPEVVMGRQLAGATLGIVGFGTIGRQLAASALALGMRVLVNDPYAAPPEPPAERVELPALLDTADFVVCLVVANERTENLFGEAEFSAMKPSAYFINLSRGNLVDEAALARALDQEVIAGAAMDVGRAPDQMPSPLLAGRPDVLATPHIGGLTPQSVEHQALETVAQVAEILQGRAPKGAVNAADWRRRELIRGGRR